MMNTESSVDRLRRLREEGRQRGDAYDNHEETRVVGFKVTPFLAKKRNVRKAKKGSAV